MYVFIQLSLHTVNVCVILVTDKGQEECVDPEGNGVTINEGAEGGPGPPSGE
jgi:hypothetical protein